MRNIKMLRIRIPTCILFVFNLISQGSRLYVHGTEVRESMHNHNLKDDYREENTIQTFIRRFIMSNKIRHAVNGVYNNNFSFAQKMLMTGSIN